MERWNRFLLDVGRLVAHPSLWRCLLHPLTRYLLAWLLTLGGAGAMLYSAWTCYDETPEEANGWHARNDGNAGHCQIDFGGQYLMGRMLVRGQGQHLYHRYYQRQVLQEAFPREDEDPAQEKSDAENLMSWTMGADDADAGKVIASCLASLAGADPASLAALAAVSGEWWTPEQMAKVTALRVGGPLYPPVNAFYYWPLALMKPGLAYRVDQVANLLLAFLAGLGLMVLSRGRVWWPVAAGLVIAFPGFSGSIQLGQNATLTLTILVWGWVLIARGFPGWGGAVWGLLAFKPVWALSILLVPLLTRRWRVVVAMAAVAAGLALLTLPFVGLHSWFEWLEIGREATATYKADNNWIHLSRDVLSIPRRWLNFDADQWQARHDDVPTAVIGWALLGAVLAVTVGVAWLRRDRLREVTGPGPAFLFLGAWLCCFHFMYYDVLLALLPVFLMLTEPRRYLVRRLMALIPLPASRQGEPWAWYYRPNFPGRLPTPPPDMRVGFGNLWVLNSPTLTLLALVLSTAYLFPLWGMRLHGFPWDTTFLAALWLWCGWLWLRPADVSYPKAVEGASADGPLQVSAVHAPQLAQPHAGVVGAHERLAHQDRPHPGLLES